MAFLDSNALSDKGLFRRNHGKQGQQITIALAQFSIAQKDCLLAINTFFIEKTMAATGQIFSNFSSYYVDFNAGNRPWLGRFIGCNNNSYFDIILYLFFRENS